MFKDANIKAIKKHDAHLNVIKAEVGVDKSNAASLSISHSCFTIICTYSLGYTIVICKRSAHFHNSIMLTNNFGLPK